MLTGPVVDAAETDEPTPRARTRIVLRVGADTPVPIASRTTGDPPSIWVEFPARQVVGSLPESTTLREGAIRSITTRYEVEAGDRGRRFIQSVQIALSGPYPHEIRSEPGRVVIELDHPASVSQSPITVGLHGSLVIEGLSAPRLSDRFRAMQDALNHATSASWTMHTTTPQEHALPLGPSASAAGERPGSSRAPSDRSPDGAAPWNAAAWIVTAAAIAGLAAWGWRRYGASLQRPAGSDAGTDSATRLSSGVLLIDQLVWRTFERQGYRLLRSQEVEQPRGSLRVVEREGTPPAALLCVGNGVFFEKQAVERFVRVMHDAGLTRGFLVASGAFTVPAQRCAQEHHVDLIGRDQLIELLGAGAVSEYASQELAEAQAQIRELEAQVRQQTEAVEMLRRQRNEASWFLGEARARAAGLEAELATLTQRLKRQETDLGRWEQEASGLRTRWQESQWYLGESQARVRFLKTQLTSLRDIARRTQQAEQAKDDAGKTVEEERRQRDALQTELLALQGALADARGRVRRLEDDVTSLQRELTAIRTYGERRHATRVHHPSARVDLWNGTHEPIFSGCPADVSPTGLGLATDHPLPSHASLRARLMFPGLPEPVQARAKLVWQRAQDQSPKHRYGCRFVGLPSSVRSQLAQLIEHLPAQGS